MRSLFNDRERDGRSGGGDAGMTSGEGSAALPVISDVWEYENAWTCRCAVRDGLRFEETGGRQLLRYCTSARSMWETALQW
jgi:hypothetical protein